MGREFGARGKRPGTGRQVGLARDLPEFFCRLARAGQQQIGCGQPLTGVAAANIGQIRRAVGPPAGPLDAQPPIRPPADCVHEIEFGRISVLAEQLDIMSLAHQAPGQLSDIGIAA